MIAHGLAAVDALGGLSTEGGRHRSPATRTRRRSLKFGTLRDQRLRDWAGLDEGGRARKRKTGVTQRCTRLLLEERRDCRPQHLRHGHKIVPMDAGAIGVFLMHIPGGAGRRGHCGHVSRSRVTARIAPPTIATVTTITPITRTVRFVATPQRMKKPSPMTAGATPSATVGGGTLASRELPE